jgi:hypothetical protein
MEVRAIRAGSAKRCTAQIKYPTVDTRSSKLKPMLPLVFPADPADFTSPNSFSLIAKFYPLRKTTVNIWEFSPEDILRFDRI